MNESYYHEKTLTFKRFPLCRFQSAYRKFHSTETALLRINNLLLASNQREVSAFVLLALSAAFDTIDHQILLARLSTFFGFSGTALSLLESYLSNRFQHVTIENHSSDPQLITTGVSQGSVLGSLFFHSILLPSATSLPTRKLNFICMPMILNFTSLSLALNRSLTLLLYLQPLSHGSWLTFIAFL